MLKKCSTNRQFGTKKKLYGGFGNHRGRFFPLFFFSNEQETIYFNHRTTQSGFQCLWGQHANRLNHLCRMLLLVSCKSLHTLFWLFELHKLFNKVGGGQDGFEDVSKWPVARTPLTVVRQPCVSRRLFCFCLVFATMNFLPGDGLVQIKMTGIMNHPSCSLSWLARGNSRSEWGLRVDQGKKCIWAGKTNGYTPWYYISACRKTNSVLWRTVNPKGAMPDSFGGDPSPKVNCRG